MFKIESAIGCAENTTVAEVTPTGRRNSVVEPAASGRFETCTSPPALMDKNPLPEGTMRSRPSAVTE